MYELFNYYKKELSDYNLIFKYMNFWFNGLIIVTGLLGLITIAVTLISKNGLLKFMAIIIFFSLFWLILYLFGQKANVVIAKRYNIVHKGFKIGGDEFYKYKKGKVKNKLDITYQTNPELIQRLKERLENESENIKVKIPPIPAIFVILFVPLWTQFMGWVFKNITSFNEGMQVFVSTLIVIIIITASLVMINKFFESIILESMNRDSYKMKQLARMLEDILIEMK